MTATLRTGPATPTDLKPTDRDREYARAFLAEDGGTGRYAAGFGFLAESLREIARRLADGDAAAVARNVRSALGVVEEIRRVPPADRDFCAGCGAPVVTDAAGRAVDYTPDAGEADVAHDCANRAEDAASAGRPR